MEITAAVPVETVKELRPGQAATLEIVRWMHDAEKLELRLDRLANRNLERDEVLALVAQPAADTQYVLATFTPLNPGTQLFPPPSSCRIRCTGARRCLLQRLLF
jgi:nitrogen fixation protein FixH